MYHIFVLRIQQREQEWLDKHRKIGHVTSPPPLPPRLMQANETPSWVDLTYWQSRYQAIATIMHTESFNANPKWSSKKGVKRKIENGNVSEGTGNMF